MHLLFDLLGNRLLLACYRRGGIVGDSRLGLRLKRCVERGEALRRRMGEVGVGDVVLRTRRGIRGCGGSIVRGWGRRLC